MADSNRERARLIPVSGIRGRREQEQRATSAFLAVLGSVREFGREVLRPLGAPAGNVTTYTKWRSRTLTRSFVRTG